MPAHLKAPGQRGGHAKRGALQALTAVPDTAIVPEMPAGVWLKPTKEMWRAYWLSGIATMANLELDSALLGRWVWCFDELIRAQKAFRKERIVMGSTGQPRLSPAWSQVKDLMAELKALEQQLGIGPLNRMRLGVAIGDAADSMASLWDEDDDDGVTFEVVSTTVDATPGREATG